MHPISVNNVNEFDPAVLPDGRILFGRWEYVDKNALTIQSLWTINPDGTQETALYANNMVFPEAILDARPVPGSHLVVGTLRQAQLDAARLDRLHRSARWARTIPRRHHEPRASRRSDLRPGRFLRALAALARTWCSSAAGRQGRSGTRLEMIDRAGHRIVVLADPEICLHSPMLVKPRPVPAGASRRDRPQGHAPAGSSCRTSTSGLTGVQRGEVKWLRVDRGNLARQPHARRAAALTTRRSWSAPPWRSA